MANQALSKVEENLTTGKYVYNGRTTFRFDYDQDSRVFTLYIDQEKTLEFKSFNLFVLGCRLYGFKISQMSKVFARRACKI